MARDEADPQKDDELNVLKDECLSAKNRYTNRSGFSPMQRVYGYTHRRPSALTSDDAIEPHMLSSSPIREHQRALDVRLAAAKALMTLDAKERVAKVGAARGRVPYEFEDGDLVFVYRKNLRKSARIGPATIILRTPTSAWCNVFGSLWKCSLEQLRQATSEEHAGSELLRGILQEMQERIKKGQGRPGYVDVSREGTPLDAPGPDRYPAARPEDTQPAPPGLADQADELQRLPQRQAPLLPALEALRKSLEEVAATTEAQTTANEPAAEETKTKKARLEEPPAPEATHDTSTTPIATDLPGSYGPTCLEAHAYREQVQLMYAYWQDRRKRNQLLDQLYCDPEARCYFHADSDIDETTGEQHSAIWSTASRCFFTVRKKKGTHEVIPEKLPSEAFAKFLASRAAEWASVKGCGAIRVCSMEESYAIRRETPERILTSRNVDTYKPAELPGDPPNEKSRWTVHGFKDPDLEEVECSSSTPTSTTIMVALQVLASSRWPVYVRDVKTAFMQGIPMNRRGGSLYSEQPPGGFPDMEPGQIIELLTEVYGLMPGPSNWRKTLKAELIKNDCRMSRYDPCFFMKYKHDNKLIGIVVVETDDLLNGGAHEHHAAMKALREKFRFGKWSCVQGERVAFAGRCLTQDVNFSIHIDMGKFINERLHAINLPRGRKRDRQALATENEISQFRAALGSVGWAAREQRVDMAGVHSLMSSTMPAPTVDDLVELNKAITHLKLTADLKLLITAIPLIDLRWLMLSDAALDNANNFGSQMAYAICATHKNIEDGIEAPINILAWKSQRCKRVCSSSLTAETYALSGALAEAEWVTTVFSEIIDGAFGPRVPLSSSRDKDIVLGTNKWDDSLKRALSIVDAKSLYDHLNRESAGGKIDRRCALEVALIRESMEILGVNIRWVPHNYMVVDGLTKKLGNLEQLLNTMRLGTFRIQSEAVQLQERAAIRASGATVPRHRRTGRGQHSGPRL